MRGPLLSAFLFALLLPTAACAATPPTTPAPAFSWVCESEAALDLYLEGRRVLRYVHAWDPATPETRHETYKCYHHVFDEAGEETLTKGSGGLYTHHRGLFIGWNRLTLDGRELDFWHMKGVTQRHVETLLLAADERTARQVVRIDWRDDAGESILSEERQVLVSRVDAPELLLLDFVSRLTPIAGELLLDGDPEHAGFQFRAHNAVAEGGPEVKAQYRFHREDVDPRLEPDLPWAAMEFGLGGKRYWVQHLNHPQNPTPTVYSAYRDYGRFGAFPRVAVALDQPLTLRYRICVGLGELPSREQLAARSAAFEAAAPVHIPETSAQSREVPE